MEEQRSAMMQKAKTLVIWGSEPRPRCGPDLHQVVAAAKSPRALIVIDPVRTEVAAHATHHLMPRPGTDGALALGILRILIEEDRVKIPVPPSDLAGTSGGWPRPILPPRSSG